ncbi:MAG: hypothetical protein F4X64_14830 [Chloroflexi bacterium]|nr:hypothetical protein [Chloroflexota bacterium]
MTTPEIDFDKRSELGWKIYNAKIKNLVEPQEKGKFLVIDVMTGDYAVNRDLIAAEDELEERQPDGVIYTIRIGYPAVFKIPRIR